MSRMSIVGMVAWGRSAFGIVACSSFENLRESRQNVENLDSRTRLIALYERVVSGYSSGYVSNVTDDR